MIAHKRLKVTVESMPGSSAAAKSRKQIGGKKRRGGEANFEHLLPERLSPSRASDYQQCPKLFYYKTILGLPTPASVATCKGTLAHYAFEKIFDHPRGERNAEKAVPYVRTHWEEISARPEYAPVLAAGKDKVEVMLTEAERLVERWFDVERPWNFDPAERELYVKAKTAGVEVHGYIDRLDKVVRADGSVSWIISDYKTGKPPTYIAQRGGEVGSEVDGPFYAQGASVGQATMITGPYVSKAFFGLNVYAFLAKKMLGIDVEKIRLIYVMNGRREDVIYQPVNEETLKKTEKMLDKVWRQIVKDAKAGRYETKRGPLCNWCHFQPECPAWATEMANVPILDRDGEPYPR